MDPSLRWDDANMIFLYILISLASLEAALASYQFFQQNIQPIPWLGITAHNPSELADSAIEILTPPERWLRAYGTFASPEILGGVLALALLIAINLIIWQIQKNNFYSNKIKPYLFGLAIILLSSGLFFSFSRSAWLGFGLGLLVTLINVWRLINAPAKKAVWQILATLIIIFGFLIIQNNHLLTAGFNSFINLQAGSTIDRVQSPAVAWRVITGAPWFGIGWGHYGNFVHDRINGNFPAWFYQPINNAFLLAWAELGIFGLLIFIALLIFMFIIARRARKNISPIPKLGLAVALLPMLVFESWIFSWPTGIITLVIGSWVFLGHW